MSSIILIVLFGTLFGYALVDSNRTGIIVTGIVFAIVCFMQMFILVPKLRRWSQTH